MSSGRNCQEAGAKARESVGGDGNEPDPMLAHYATLCTAEIWLVKGERFPADLGSDEHV